MRRSLLPFCLFVCCFFFAVRLPGFAAGRVRVPLKQLRVSDILLPEGILLFRGYDPAVSYVVLARVGAPMCPFLETVLSIYMTSIETSKRFLFLFPEVNKT